MKDTREKGQDLDLLLFGIGVEPPENLDGTLLFPHKSTKIN